MILHTLQCSHFSWNFILLMTLNQFLPTFTSLKIKNKIKKIRSLNFVCFIPLKLTGNLPNYVKIRMATQNTKQPLIENSGASLIQKIEFFDLKKVFPIFFPYVRHFPAFITQKFYISGSGSFCGGSSRSGCYVLVPVVQGFTNVGNNMSLNLSQNYRLFYLFYMFFFR